MDMTILTDVGQRRTNNQDYANQYKNKAGKSMVFLADGMGGHRAGNIASEMAVTDLGAAWFLLRSRRLIKYGNGLQNI